MGTDEQEGTERTEDTDQANAECGMMAAKRIEHSNHKDTKET
jgi:hypothetical protein